jgi:outer membrane receptor protein involved in Fe transport
MNTIAGRISGPVSLTAGRARAVWIIRAAVAAMIAGTASLPAVAAEPAATAGEETLTEVVVTGSRIRRQDLEANSPTVTAAAELFENTGTLGVETVLNQLPQFVPALTQFSATTNQATATVTPGASLVNLRGLGSFRTLTLVDGRRATPLNAQLNVDTNSIPSAAIERVEIISGGASAVYGADAVAGVVNFILKDRFQGLDLTARYGITEEGDGQESQVSGLIGTTFADGRGNVMVGLEWADRGKAYDVNRSWLRRNFSNPLTASNETWSDTYVDFSLVPSGVPAGTTAAAAAPNQAAINAIFGARPTAACVLPTGAACTYPSPTGKYFVNRSGNGTGSLYTGALGFGAVNGNSAMGTSRYNGGFGDPDLPYRKLGADGTLRQNNLDALSTVPLSRVSMFGKAEYEFAENVSAYLRGNLAHTETSTQGAYSQAVNNWTATIPVGFEGTLWADSRNANGTTKAAYLPGGAYGLNCPATGGCTESQAFPLPPELEQLLRSRATAYRNADIKIHRIMDYLPLRNTHNRNTTVGMTAGLEGTLPNNWTWDAAVSYGTTESVSVQRGVVDLAQYIAVVTSPNYGKSFSRSGISPTSSGVGTCTTGLPIFRDFAVSQDCIDAISFPMQTSGQIEQSAADFNLVGDLFELPAGEVKFALGADWRKWDYEYINDHLNGSFTFITQPVGVFPQGNTDAQLSTKEVYGELLVPIVKGLPLVKEFNLELGGRHSDYSTSGGVNTWKVLGDWVVTDWARLRGGLNRATRAPNLAEQFLGKSQVTVTLSDPCSRAQSGAAAPYSANAAANPAGAAAVEALCRSLMTQAAADAYYSLPANQQPQSATTTSFLVGSAAVQPETADTWTAGLVLRSPFASAWLSGLGATIDWYSIQITDIISQQSINDVWKACVLANSASSAECAVVGRDPFDGRPSQSLLSYTNVGQIRFNGVDVALNWRARFSELGFESLPGVVSLNSQITIPTKRNIYSAVTGQWTEYKDTLGCASGVACSGYKYQAFTTLGYSTGPLSMSLRWNYYPSIEAADKAVNPATRQRGVFEAYSLLSLSGSYQLSSSLTLRAGVDNLFDVEPPLAGGAYAADGTFWTTSPPALATPALPSGDARYDQLGRRFFVGLNLQL